MAIRTSLTVLLAELGQLVALAAGGTVEIRTGAQPATPQTAASGTLLGTCALGTPAFGSPAANGNNGRIVANAIADDADADATGVAGWFRVKSALGDALFDGSISEAGGGGDGIIDDADIQIGGRIRILSLTYTLPM